MFPRQPSNVPMIEPTSRPSTSATRTLAGPPATARRKSSAVSVTLGVASACRHSSRTASTSSSRQSRMDRPLAWFSIIVAFLNGKGPQQPQSATGLLSVQPASPSVEEGHVLHRLRLSLRVHQDPVPTVQGDGGVVGVPDAATDVDAGIAPHGAPAPALRLRTPGQDALVLRLGDAVRVPGADVDRLAARPVAKFSPMRLAAVVPAQRLVGQDQLLIHGEPWSREEEPLALADEGGVLAAVAGLGPEALAGLGAQDLGGLEGFLGLADGADRGGFGDAGDEPVPFVVAAEELALVLTLSDEEQQVAVAGLNIEDGDL